MQVQTTSLDELIAELGLDGRVGMIKIDVEGAEMMVLRGATQTLRGQPQPIIVMDIHPYLGVDPDEVCCLLEGLGYAIFEEAAPFNIPLRKRSQDQGKALPIVARPLAGMSAADDTALSR